MIFRLCLTLFSHIVVVLAICECGFTTESRGRGDSPIFTDVVETDFLRLLSLDSTDDWAVQVFNKTRERARGEFGEMFSRDNVLINPPSHDSPPGESDDGDSSGHGLQLVVKANTVDGMVPVGEIATKRGDIYHGTFRASIKLTRSSGTCTAFYWV